jgi:two-component system, OmpR family, sensor histidine kinase BaeS
MNRLVVRLLLTLFFVVSLTALSQWFTMGYLVYLIFEQLPQKTQNEVANYLIPILERVNLDTDPQQSWILSGLLFGSLIIGSIGMIGISRRIARPIEAVSRSAQRISAGELSSRAEVPLRWMRGNSETARLLRHFNQMAQSLEHLEEERKATVAAIAHELRTPLTVLRGRLEALRDGVLTLDTQETAILLDQVGLLSRMVVDLRTLSLADAGQLPLERQDIDLALLLSDVVGGFSSRANERGLEVRLEAISVQGYIDHERIYQVVGNLLENAIRYGANDDHNGQHLANQGILVSLRPEMRQAITHNPKPKRRRRQQVPEFVPFAVIEVRDHGPGIPSEALPHLFERFYRPDASRGRASGGSGLGLAIVRTIVELHGGEVTVQNHPDGGACFAVWLPLVGSGREPSQTNSIRPSLLSQTRPKPHLAQPHARGQGVTSTTALGQQIQVSPDGAQLQAVTKKSAIDAAVVTESAFQPAPMLSVLYHLLAMPLAVTYFIVMVVGLSLGAILSIVGVGIPLLWLSLGVVRVFSGWERWLSEVLLGQAVPYAPNPSTNDNWWLQQRSMMAENGRFRVLLYFFLKLPVAVFNWILSMTLPSFAVWLIAMSIAALFGRGIIPDLPSNISPILFSIISASVGIGLLSITLPLLHILAEGWGKIVVWCLGNTPKSATVSMANRGVAAPNT